MSATKTPEEELHEAWIQAGATATESDGPQIAAIFSALQAYQSSLSQRNDPRSRLIAMDLQQIPWNSDENRALIAQCVGLDVASSGAVDTLFGMFSCILLDGDETIFAKLLASSGAAYLSDVSLRGHRATVVACLQMLTRSERKWLGNLDIIFRANTAVDDKRLIDEELTRRLVSVTPYLKSLYIRGRYAVGSLVHSSVRVLILDGADAVALGDSRFSSVDLLDLRLIAPNEQPNSSFDCLGISRATFPSLQNLNLSRNEPAMIGYRIDVLSILSRSDLLDQLTHLWLPAIQTEDDRKSLQDLLDQMPKLVCLQLPADSRFQVFNHDRATISCAEMEYMELKRPHY